MNNSLMDEMKRYVEKTLNYSESMDYLVIVSDDPWDRKSGNGGGDFKLKDARAVVFDFFRDDVEFIEKCKTAINDYRDAA